jgi:type II secretory pathway component HofQ
MKRYLAFSLAALVMTCMLGSLAIAQAPQQAPPASTIKLQVVLARYEGDKKVSSFPYVLSLIPGQHGNIRNGSEIAVASSAGAGNAYTLQQVGTQIDATVTPVADGKFSLNLLVTDRSIVTGAPAAQGGVSSVPSFRNNNTSTNAILSAGETIQFTSSPDKTGNETLKIEVTLTVGNK